MTFLSRDTSRPRRRSVRRGKPWSRSSKIALAGTVAGILLIAGWWLRGSLHRRARAVGLQRTELHWNGIDAQTADRALPGGLGRLHAIGVQLRWFPSPVRIEIEHLNLEPPPAPRAPKPPAALRPAPQRRPTSSARASGSWLNERDWELRIRHGPRLSLSNEHEAALHDIHVTKMGEQLRLRAQLELPTGVRAPLSCSPTRELSWTSIHLSCVAPGAFEEPFDLRISRRSGQLRVSLTQAGSSVKIEGQRRSGSWRIAGSRVPFRWGVAASHMFFVELPSRLRFRPDARWSGTATLEAAQGPERKRVLHLQELQLDGIEIEHPRLAPTPVLLPELALTGRVEVSQVDPRTQRGELRFRVGALAGQARWSFDNEQHALRIEVPEQPCMEWIGAWPRAMRPALEGLRLQGHSPGALEIHYDPARLTQFDELDPKSLPGELHVAFPFFERCKVLNEPTIVAQTPLRSSRGLVPWQPPNTKNNFTQPPRFLSVGHMPLFSRAMTVTEDPNFWDHQGFDYRALEIAVWYDLAKQRVARGASTISQQCARILWLGTRRDIARKLQEVVLTWRLEANAPKRRILEIYLNLIELGPHVYGANKAARFYFGRSLAQLNLKEKVFLATLAPAPGRKSVASQHGSISHRWREQITQQIERLRIRGWVSTETAQLAAQEPLRLKVRGPRAPAAKPRK